MWTQWECHILLQAKNKLFLVLTIISMVKVSPHKFLEIYSHRFFKIAIPVVFTLLVDAYMTRLLEGKAGAAYMNRNLIETMGSNNSGLTVAQSLYTALYLIASIIIVTAILLCLYYYNCMKIIYGWLIFSVSLLLSVYLYIAAGNIPKILNLPVDWITVCVFALNMATVGNMSIFWRAPAIITQMFLIIISVLTSLVFLWLPDWTVWILLVLLVIYDACVVLCPFGLLNLLLQKSEERGDAIPALVYSTTACEPGSGSSSPGGSVAEASFAAEEEEDASESGRSSLEQPLLEGGRRRRRKRDGDEGIKLGLGDFVFYGILVTRAARLGWDIAVLCVFAVILGLSLTLIVLAVLERPLPALPLSLLLGIAFFVVGALTFRRFGEALRGAVAVF